MVFPSCAMDLAGPKPPFGAFVACRFNLPSKRVSEDAHQDRGTFVEVWPSDTRETLGSRKCTTVKSAIRCIARSHIQHFTKVDLGEF